MTEELTLCDLTQSYSAAGGGIRTYLTTKRQFLDKQTKHRHLLIIPGPNDHTTYEGRHITVEIKSPRVPGSPNYRLLLRSRAVIKTLHKYTPKTIECLDAYNLPWAAIAYRKEVPDTFLIAGYRTDFPTVYVEMISRKFLGNLIARKLKARAYKYAGKLYSHFDSVYALNTSMANRLCGLGAGDVKVLPLGTDIDVFHPNKRDYAWREKLNADTTDPILVYAGRLDKEKQADVVVDAFLKLTGEMKATLVMLGDGNLKTTLMKKTAGKRVSFPGFISKREELAKILASSDIYVSAMAFETFGISIIEAQACGLPVIGVAAGAMPDRVGADQGLLGAPGDAKAMAQNITNIWNQGQAKPMGRNARIHVVNNFSWGKTFEHLYENIYAIPVKEGIATS